MMIRFLTLALLLALAPSVAMAANCRRKCVGAIASCRAAVPALSTVAKPIFVVRSYVAPVVPQVSVGGVPVSANDGTAQSGAFVFLDTARNELWMTLNQTVSTPVDVHVGH
jgi:hypothetical protein